MENCDISHDNITNAKDFTSEFKDFIKFYVSDSIIFKKF